MSCSISQLHGSLPLLLPAPPAQLLITAPEPAAAETATEAFGHTSSQQSDQETCRSDDSSAMESIPEEPADGAGWQKQCWGALQWCPSVPLLLPPPAPLLLQASLDAAVAHPLQMTGADHDASAGQAGGSLLGIRLERYVRYGLRIGMQACCNCWKQYWNHNIITLFQKLPSFRKLTSGSYIPFEYAGRAAGGRGKRART